jgi:hypothetical protein
MAEEVTATTPVETHTEEPQEEDDALPPRKRGRPPQGGPGGSPLFSGFKCRVRARARGARYALRALGAPPPCFGAARVPQPCASRAPPHARAPPRWLAALRRRT